MGLILTHLSGATTNGQVDSQNRAVISVTGSTVFHPLQPTATVGVTSLSTVAPDSAYIFSGTVGGNDKTTFLGDVVISGSISAGSGISAGSVAGSNTQIQFNSSDSFAGDSDLTWTAASNTLLVGDTSDDDAAVSLGAGDIKLQTSNDGGIQTGGLLTDSGTKLSITGTKASDTSVEIAGVSNVSMGSGTGTLTLVTMAAAKDISLTSVLGSVNILGKQTAADSIYITGSGVQICASDTTNGLQLGASVSGVPVSIGHSTSETTINDNLTVTGDLTVNGATVTVDVATVTVEDPMIKLASGNNSTDTVDIGFYGLCDPSNSQDTYTGLVRDADDAEWHLFDLLQAEPTTTINKSGTGFDHADLTVGALTADDASTFSAGLDCGNAAITNVGDIDCDSISIADAASGLNVDFSGADTGTGVITLKDAVADALSITDGTNDWMVFNTSAETLTFGRNTTFASTTIANLGTVSAATSITSTAFVGPIDGIVGGNTPAAGSFTTIGATGVVSVSDGTAGAPAITNTGDANCGLYFSAEDTLAFTAGGTAQFTMADGAIAPVTDNDVNLGASNLRWANIYTGDLNLRNDRGDWTLIEEEDFLSFRNNVTGRRYRMVMEDITGLGNYGPGNDGEM